MKVYRILWVAAIVAGVSFAATSCDKDSRLAIDEPIVVEAPQTIELQTVELPSLTKGGEIDAAISAATAAAKEALGDFLGFVYAQNQAKRERIFDAFFDSLKWGDNYFERSHNYFHFPLGSLTFEFLNESLNIWKEYKETYNENNEFYVYLENNTFRVISKKGYMIELRLRDAGFSFDSEGFHPYHYENVDFQLRIGQVKDVDAPIFSDYDFKGLIVNHNNQDYLDDAPDYDNVWFKTYGDKAACFNINAVGDYDEVPQFGYGHFDPEYGCWEMGIWTFDPTDTHIYVESVPAFVELLNAIQNNRGIYSLTYDEADALCDAFNDVCYIQINEVPVYAKYFYEMDPDYDEPYDYEYKFTVSLTYGDYVVDTANVLLWLFTEMPLGVVDPMI